MLIKFKISYTTCISLAEIASASHDSESKTTADSANNLLNTADRIPTYDWVFQTLFFDKTINWRYIGFFNREAIGNVSIITLKMQFRNSFKHSFVFADDTSYSISINDNRSFSTTATKLRLDIKIERIIVPK